MDIKRKIQEFNKRWSIINDSDYKEEFIKFKTRVINIFRHDVDNYVTHEGKILFCQILGIEYEQLYGRSISTALFTEYDEKKFYRLLQIISYLPFSFGKIRSNLFSRLAEAIEFSNINLAMTAKGDEIILYPRGEKELDQKLVEEVLSFLNEESQKHFIDALKFYEKGTTGDSIKSAESIRRTIEEFLRFKLQNKKGLVANIKELQSRLKQDNRDPTVRNIIFQTFSYLDQYFNENSKHKDGDISGAENEFLIYQAGVLMRYAAKVIS